MSYEFAGKGFIITGGASGIGLATAKLLKKQGANVVLWDVNAAALQNKARELNAYSIPVDVTLPEEVEVAMKQSLACLGELQGIIHCAGIMRTGLHERIDFTAHRKMVEINFIGTLIIIQAALPYLKKTKGTLILLGSISAFSPSPEFATYAATKGGVANLAQTLHVELADTGVHIGLVNPFFVDSPMLDNQNRQTRYVRLFGMVHTTDEVARSILHGITRRKFMIWPSWYPHLLFILSRLSTPSLTCAVSRLLWRWQMRGNP
jgi:short-subunit dehydrogenase